MKTQNQSQEQPTDSSAVLLQKPAKDQERDELLAKIIAEDAALLKRLGR